MGGGGDALLDVIKARFVNLRALRFDSPSRCRTPHKLMHESLLQEALVCRTVGGTTPCLPLCLLLYGYAGGGPLEASALILEA